MTRTIDRMIEQEVLVCLSSLVSTVAQGYGSLDSSTAQLSDLAEQAMELTSPVLDYEEAAREAGFKLKRLEDGAGESAVEFFAWRGDDENEPDDETATDASAAVAWADACNIADIDPNEREVFEHWAVTDWFAEKLEAAGEKVDTDFAGMAVWARTTTGQAIKMDAVIQQIYAETRSVEG